MQFINLKTQYLAYKEEIDGKIFENINNSSFILGKDVSTLESTLAEYVGVKHAVACGSGTDALLLPLLANDIKLGDEIITTVFSFIATAEVISFIGATPVFVDIDERNYNFNIDQIVSMITPKTKGIIAVSLFGQMPDMDRINRIAKEHGLFVIEDAAQSFGAEYKGKKSCGTSDYGATSFFPSKPLGCYGDGGMVFTNDEKTAKKMKSLSMHGQSERYVHKYVGLNFRMDTIQAGIVLAKFKHFEDEARKRKIIGEKYSALLKDSVIVPFIEKYTDRSVYAQYSMRVKNRAEVIKNLTAKGVPTAVHYPIPIHLQEAYRYLGYKSGDFPVSEKIAQEIMSIPMHPFLADEDIGQIVSAVKESVIKSGGSL